jgi:hypothetical protein
MTWQLQNESPVVEVHLRDPLTGSTVPRTLLADTGAGRRNSKFELVLSDADCQRLGGQPIARVGLGGALIGQFPVYAVWVEIPARGVVRQVDVAAVPTSQLPHGLDGIAAFRFLNSFTYGNFGDANLFGLETP